jgi:hypothetical protein
MSIKLQPELKERLLRAPEAPVRLIVGVEGDLGARAEEAGRRGLTVHRRLAIVTALAIEATGRQALDLAGEPWVTWLEEDREVRALQPQGPTHGAQ